MADELDPLRSATRGLLYPSDTDAPFEVVSNVTVPAGGSVSSVDSFFNDLKGDDDAAKFQKLRQAVYATLGDAKVYRIGGPTVDVYILGTMKNGALGGLKTKSVET